MRPAPFHVMAKPGGAACNLDCSYCYYLGKQTLPGGPGAGRMSDATLERFIADYIAAAPGDEVVFSWQGGEPSLLGLDFFRKAVALQRRHARPGLRVENDLQTNGTLLDDEWCSFLKEHRFLVGLSIDGPRELHDRHRTDKGGHPTFDRVFGAALLLQKHGVAFNTLTCVHRHNARRPIDVYRFLRDECGSTYMQFIPVVEYKGFDRLAPGRLDPARLPVSGTGAARPGNEDSVVSDWSVAPDDWGYFLCSVFDRWIKNDVGKITVNHFESLVARHIGLGAQLCVYAETCGRGLAVEHDGGVYSCDHYVYPEHRLGDVRTDSLGRMAGSAEQVRFGDAKRDTLPRACRDCAFLPDCRGECPKNRIVRTAEGESGLNYLCPGFKRYFNHAIPLIAPILASLRRQAPSRLRIQRRSPR